MEAAQSGPVRWRLRGVLILVQNFSRAIGQLRIVLREESLRSRQNDIIRLLEPTIADAQSCGVEQQDGNLTNFLIGSDDRIMFVDEDDIRICPGMLPLTTAVSNLASIAARLPDEEMVAVLLSSYLEVASVGSWLQSSQNAFWFEVKAWRAMLKAKRASRNIAPRHFD